MISTKMSTKELDELERSVSVIGIRAALTMAYANGRADGLIESFAVVKSEEAGAVPNGPMGDTVDRVAGERIDLVPDMSGEEKQL